MFIKVLGRYDLVSELGHGPHGVVYLATDTRMSRQVAIKKIGPISLSQTEDILRDARVASNLHQHAIVPLNDLGAAEGTVYLVYTLIAGESLAQALKRSGAMSAANAVPIVLDVLDALAYAHGQGVLHLDIKPSNVMISPSGQHYVLDFGIARSISKVKRSSADASEASVHMAPELASAQGGEIRSDIYSAGMLLYEMLNASTPATGGNVKPDTKLLNIILKASEKNPKDRYPSSLSDLKLT